MRGVLPAKNLRDQPGLYRSEDDCGVSDTTSFGDGASAGVAVLIVGKLDWEGGTAPWDVFGSEAVGVLAGLLSEEVVGASTPLGVAELVGGVLEEEDGLTSDFVDVVV